MQATTPIILPPTWACPNTILTTALIHSATSHGVMKNSNGTNSTDPILPEDITATVTEDDQLIELSRGPETEISDEIS